MPPVSKSLTTDSNYKCDVQNVGSVIHLAAQRPNRKIGLIEVKGMRTKSD